MLVEHPVLSGNEGIQHLRRQLRKADNLTVFVGGKLCDYLSIYIQQPSWQGCGKFREIFCIDGISGFCQQKAQYHSEKQCAKKSNRHKYICPLFNFSH